MQKIKSVSSQLGNNKIVPVVVLRSEEQAIGLCEALLKGGVSVIEVTLRNSFGLRAIEIIANRYPQMLLLAGTVNSVTDYKNAVDAGVQGIISPGITPALLDEAYQHSVSYLPGVATASDILQGMQYGLGEFKLFPASVAGGVAALKAFSGPFKEVQFCPTGGVNQQNYQDFLALANVMCVGGSWIASSQMIEQGKWPEITRQCSQIVCS